MATSRRKYPKGYSNPGRKARKSRRTSCKRYVFTAKRRAALKKAQRAAARKYKFTAARRRALAKARRAR